VLWIHPNIDMVKAMVGVIPSSLMTTELRIHPTIDMAKAMVGIILSSVMTTVFGIHLTIDMVQAMVGVIPSDSLMTTELKTDPMSKKTLPLNCNTPVMINAMGFAGNMEELKTDPMIDLRRITTWMNPAAR
jgi:hypothetical protein